MATKTKKKPAGRPVKKPAPATPIRKPAAKANKAPEALTAKAVAAMQKELKAAFKDFGRGMPATPANRAKLDAMLKAANEAREQLRTAKAQKAERAAVTADGTKAPLKTRKVKLLPAQGDIEALALDAAHDRLVVLSRSARSLRFRFVAVTLSTGQGATVVERDGMSEGNGFQARGLGVLPDGRFVTSVDEVSGNRGRVSPWILDVDAGTLTPPAASTPWRSLESTSIVSLGKVRLSPDGTQATCNLDHVDTTWSLGATGFTLNARAKPVPELHERFEISDAFKLSATVAGRRYERKVVPGSQVAGASDAGLIALTRFKEASTVLDLVTGKVLFEKDLRMRSPAGAMDASGTVAAFGYGTDVQLVAL
jgi:hypothetical protein